MNRGDEGVDSESPLALVACTSLRSALASLAAVLASVRLTTARPLSKSRPLPGDQTAFA
jgi:hypothetical protein